MPVRLRGTDIFDRQPVRLVEMRMSVPLTEHLGSLGDPPCREHGIHDAVRLTTTPGAVRHRAIDASVLSINETKVLVLRRTRTIGRKLLANVGQHFVFEALRWSHIARPSRKAPCQQYPHRSEDAEHIGA